MRTAWLFLLLVPLAAAHDEAEAPLLRDDVVAVWHEPGQVPPGTQWQGFIRFAEEHNVTDVRYQICIVGQACFAPPALAVRQDEHTWAFDTNDYRAGRNPVQWGVEVPGGPASWRVGMQFFLFFDGQEPVTANGTAFPRGIEEVPDPETCDYSCYVAWSETHYLAFDMATTEAQKQSPFDAPWLALVAALWLVRRR